MSKQLSCHSLQMRHLSELLTVLLSLTQLIRFLKEWIRYKDVSLQWVS